MQWKINRKRGLRWNESYFGCTGLRRPLWGGESWEETQTEEKTKQDNVQESYRQQGRKPWYNTQIWPFCPLFSFYLPNSLLFNQGHEHHLNVSLSPIQILLIQYTFQGRCQASIVSLNITVHHDLISFYIYDFRDRKGKGER